MKTNALQFKKMFDFAPIKSNVKTALIISAQWLLIFLLASVDKVGFALSLALTFALTYARQNVIVLAPCFIIANCVFSLSWWMLLYCFVPMLLLFCLYALFYLLKRNVPLWAEAICALLSMAPYAVCTAVFYQAYMLVAIGSILCVVFVFCYGIGAYAVLVRGVFHKATVDEIICLAISLCSFAYALSFVGGYSFWAYHVLLTLGAVFCSACFPPAVTLIFGVICGGGASIAFSSVTWLAEAVAIATVAVAFSPFTRFSSALATIAVEGLLWLFEAYPGAGWQSLIMCATGAIACLCIPKTVFAKVKSLSTKDNRRSYAGIVNRRGREIAYKLSSASNVFYDMSKNLEKIAKNGCDLSSEKLAEEVANRFCAKCKDRDSCFGALGTNTSSVIKPIADAVINRGKATILDMPPFITSRCNNMHSLVQVINNTASQYKLRMDEARGIATCKSMMSEQFAGISLVLDALAEESAKQVNFANDGVELLKSDLLKHNIVADEVVLSENDKGIDVTMTVRAQDAKKAILPRLVSKNLRCKTEVVKVSERGEQRLVYLSSAPCFEVAYGIADKRYDDIACGDCVSVLCPSRTRRLFALCDGMGHGQSASEASNNAVSMIESFYRAGIDGSIVLSLVNKLLRLCFEEAFSTLDIAVIDMQSGELDVVKLGSASSFIIRKENIQMLSCTSAPMGIVDDVESITARYQLFDGDMLLMMSDGVFDVLEGKGIAEAIDNIATSNPQTLADEILKMALENGAHDDCTVIAMRLFAT